MLVFSCLAVLKLLYCSELVLWCFFVSVKIELASWFYVVLLTFWVLNKFIISMFYQHIKL
jgi:hypothetical protein